MSENQYSFDYFQEQKEFSDHIVKKILKILLKNGEQFRSDISALLYTAERRHLDIALESLLAHKFIERAPGTVFEPKPKQLRVKLTNDAVRVFRRDPDILLCFCERCTEIRFGRFERALEFYRKNKH